MRIYTYLLEEKMATIITVTNLKGGVGKSTISALLGVAAYLDGLRVAWIDTDPQGTLSNFANKRDEAYPQFISIPEDTDLDAALRFLQQSDEFDLVLVDTRPVIAEEVLTCLYRSSAALIPIRAAPADLEAVGVTHAVCAKIGLPFRFIVNDSRKTKLRERCLIQLSEFGSISSPMINTRLAYEMMLGNGQTPMEERFDPNATEEMRELWAGVRRWLDANAIMKHEGASLAEGA